MRLTEHIQKKQAPKITDAPAVRPADAQAILLFVVFPQTNQQTQTDHAYARAIRDVTQNTPSRTVHPPRDSRTG
jgi:hypothetical protein